jgi:uncharacterized protein HemX
MNNKYFILLLVCLVIASTGGSAWFWSQNKRLTEESQLLKAECAELRNEQSLLRVEIEQTRMERQHHVEMEKESLNRVLKSMYDLAERVNDRVKEMSRRKVEKE